ncbi:MAG TPA: hypothetical protein VFE78_03570 [Gemmataceae bacterium]|jgi:hypothetical protein|nr:hypothetical protein [Gemmataceae bacterium]
MAGKKWHFVPDSQSLDHYGWQDDRLSERKRFLFMAAIGRHLMPLMTGPDCIRVVEACEELAEGVIDNETFCEIHAVGQRAAEATEALAIGAAANDFVRLLADDYKHNECIYYALDALGYVAATEAGVLKPSATSRQAQAIWQHPVFIAGKEAAERTFLGYMHDIFGPNPYKPAKSLRGWRTETVKSVAQKAYELRDFSALPILADALEDAGCNNTDILNHLRSSGPHVRGCWCLDAVLGKKPRG